ncbi:MAG: corrinoid protein [Deltaproteobacteria bacterium]|nr:corrinoid protein [Deltaproteobacteria bacterium]
MAVREIYDAVLAFDGKRAADRVREELDRGTDVQTILNAGLISAMDEVGRRFSEGDLFLPEMLLAAKTMKAGLEVLRPRLSAAAGELLGTVVIATVKGDLHDIGKNLVAMMLEGAGFKVINLGADVDADGFVRAAKDNKADLVCLSALLTTTMPAMAATVKAVRASGCPARILVGGAPVTQGFADQIGADGYGTDAPGAVALARKLMAEPA